MDLIYQKYVNEKADKDGRLLDIDFKPTPDFNFGFDIVDELGRNKPDKAAMLWVSKNYEERLFTFKDMMEYTSKTANYFKSLGIKRGDKVMLILKRHYQFWFSIIALHKIGAVVVPATNQLKKKDLVYRFETAGISAIVCTSDGDISDSVDSAVKECSFVKIKSIVNGKKDGWDSFEEGILKASPDFPRPTGDLATKAHDLMIMYFTSGTTSYPKIAMHSFTYPLGHVVTAKYWHNVDPNGLHLTTSETGWAKSVWGKLYGQWLCEACVFTYDFDKFSASDLLGVISKYKITTFCAPPTFYRFFLQEDLTKYDLSSLKYTTIAGEALNSEVYSKFYNLTGLKMMEGYGQTELTVTIANLIGTEPKPGSMGLPNPQFAVELLNAEGKSVKTGEVGEIVINTNKKHPCGMFLGYYQDEEKTNSVWNDGLYHTGDMAWRDEDGYFWFVGRTDDLIKSSGYRIGPFEIESVLMEHPAVMECAVTGVPDPVRGQAVKATIVLSKNYQPSEELKKEIQNYVKKQTAPYKYPRIIEFLPELPKTISGKIRRTELRDSENKL